MKKIATITMTMAIVVSAMTGCVSVPEVDIPETSEPTVIELTPARAQDDYYRFVNEERFKTAKIKYGEQSVEEAFKTDLIDEQLETIIDDCVSGSGYAKGSEEDIIKHAFEYYQAYDFKSEPIPEDLMAMIEKVDHAASVDELLETDAELIKDYGLGGLVNLYTDTNPFDPTERVIMIDQISGVLEVSFTDLREDSYGINTIKKDATMILNTRGYDKETCETYGKELAFLALDLFGATDLDYAEDSMKHKYIKAIPASDVESIMSNVDMKKYLEAIGIDYTLVNKYCVADQKQLKMLNDILVDKNLNALKAWELGRLYSNYMDYIAPHYEQFEAYVGRSYDSMHDQAVTTVKRKFSQETDPIYVERYYSAETDKALRSMCDDIRAGYRELISNASWLSEATRTELLAKLENIIYITGTDLKRHNNAEYADIYGNNYYELCLNYDRLSRKKMIDEFNHQDPVSRSEIAMPMQMMNACYNPYSNNITITAAITNDPFFNPNADYYTNLGGLGAVIAHEMGHAFDSNCILFNSKGEYDPSWISDSDMQTLNERDEKAARYFEDNFIVFGVYHVDGEQTLGENYADLGGVECVCSLTKTKEDRIKLFESYARIWCEIITDEAIINQIAYDEHSPSYIRVNAILASIDEFYDTYDVKEGDSMYIAPEDRISRWY